jgi:hypothetical protein
MNLGEISSEDVKWTELAQDPVKEQALVLIMSNL